MSFFFFWLWFVNIPTDWEDILGKGIGVWQGKKLKGLVYKLAWARLDSVHIWRHHYDVKFGNLLHSEEQVFQKI